MINQNGEDILDFYKENQEEKKLMELLINPELYNNNKAKIISKDNYDFIIQLIYP